ncbi:MAG: glucosyl transferase [bacterium]
MSSNKNLKAKITMSIILLLIAVLFAMSCKECPTEPENHNNDLADTTSHNFTWEIDTLCDYSGCLNDVWVVDENNIWVVGEIIMHDPDSSWNGTGFETFNAAHWNGEEWEYIHIRGNLMNDVGPLYSIWYFDDSNIWVSTGFPVHWDGVKWTLYHIQNMGINASVEYGIWASSPSNIYFVGYRGSIVHYDGSSFKKIESGTTLDVRDIWGAKNKRSGKWEILAIASNDLDKCLLRIQNKTVTKLSDDSLSNILDGIWFVPNYQYYVVGAGIHFKSKLDDSSWSRYPSGEVTSYQSHDITGSGINDIFVVGSFCEVVHFNGSTWHNYRNEIPFAGGALGGVSVIGNLIAIAGHIGREAVVIIGRR